MFKFSFIYMYIEEFKFYRDSLQSTNFLITPRIMIKLNLLYSHVTSFNRGGDAVGRAFRKQQIFINYGFSAPLSFSLICIY